MKKDGINVISTRMAFIKLLEHISIQLEGTTKVLIKMVLTRMDSTKITFTKLLEQNLGRMVGIKKNYII